MLIFYLSLLLTVFILVFPLKISFYISSERIVLKIFSFKLLDQESLQAAKEFQEATIENIEKEMISKDDLIYINILKKFKIKKLYIEIGGFKNDFDVVSIMYGIFYLFFANADYYFYHKGVDFCYSLNYESKTYFKIDGIVKTSLGKILLEYFRLRRKKYGRTSNSSASWHIIR